MGGVRQPSAGKQVPAALDPRLIPMLNHVVEELVREYGAAMTAAADATRETHSSGKEDH